MLIEKLNRNGKEAAGNVAAGLPVVLGLIVLVSHDPLCGWAWDFMIGACFFCLLAVVACIAAQFGAKWQPGALTVTNLVFSVFVPILALFARGLS